MSHAPEKAHRRHTGLRSGMNPQAPGSSLWPVTLLRNSPPIKVDEGTKDNMQLRAMPKGVHHLVFCTKPSTRNCHWCLSVAMSEPAHRPASPPELPVGLKSAPPAWHDEAELALPHPAGPPRPRNFVFFRVSPQRSPALTPSTVTVQAAAGAERGARRAARWPKPHASPAPHEKNGMAHQRHATWRATSGMPSRPLQCGVPPESAESHAHQRLLPPTRRFCSHVCVVQTLRAPRHTAPACLARLNTPHAPRCHMSCPPGRDCSTHHDTPE